MDADESTGQVSEAPGAIASEAVRAPRRVALRRRSDARWSGVPLAASLALVAFSVLFGIYGPRVVDRSSPPLGIPAWELGNMAMSYHQERLMGPMNGEGAGITTTTEAESEASSLLGISVRLPDADALGWTVHRPRPITLPGSAKGVQVFYSRPLQIGNHHQGLSLVLVPDNEQYVVYSPFGRPLLLPPWDPYPVAPSDELGIDSAALLWSNGRVVHILTALSEATIDSVAEAFLDANAPPSATIAEPMESSGAIRSESAGTPR